jgi:hypothetical protein
LTAGAVIVMITSGVVRSPGTAVGVVAVYVVSVLVVPRLVPVAPGLPSESTAAGDAPEPVHGPGSAPVPMTVNCVGERIEATGSLAVTLL